MMNLVCLLIVLSFYSLLLFPFCSSFLSVLPLFCCNFFSLSLSCFPLSCCSLCCLLPLRAYYSSFQPIRGPSFPLFRLLFRASVSKCMCAWPFLHAFLTSLSFMLDTRLALTFAHLSAQVCKYFLSLQIGRLFFSSTFLVMSLQSFSNERILFNLTRTCTAYYRRSFSFPRVRLPPI